MLKYKSKCSESKFGFFTSDQSELDENGIEQPSIQEQQKIFFNLHFNELHSRLVNKRDDKTLVLDMINFLGHFKPSFYSFYNDIIPIIIQSGTFEIILDQIDDLTPMIFQLFTQIVHCQTNNLVLLLQNNFCHSILSKMLICDNDICRFSVECLNEIISRGNFLYTLIFSANIIELIHHFLRSVNQTNFQQNEEKVCFCLTFLGKFFEKGPIPNKCIPVDGKTVLNTSYQNFIVNCKNPELFNSNLYQLFLQVGIEITSKISIFYQILDISFDMANKTKSMSVIYDYLSLVYYIIGRNTSTFEFIFVEIPFFEHFSEWIEIPKVEIVTRLMEIVSCIFITENSIYKTIIEECISGTFYVFDNRIDECEELEYHTVSALVNLISYLGWESRCIKKILKKERRKKVECQLMNSSFRLQRSYAYLIISIASNSIECNKILTPNVLEQIFSFMDKKKGNFIIFVLDNFERIFKNNQLRDFRKTFIDCGGEDLLYEYIDSDENEEVVAMSEEILDKYFKEADDQ